MLYQIIHTYLVNVQQPLVFLQPVAQKAVRKAGERRLAVLLDDHALPNVGDTPLLYGPKLSDFWYNRHSTDTAGPS